MATAASLKKAAKTRAAKKALMGKTLPHLRKMAKAKNLHGYSTLNKGALVTMLVKGKSPKKITKTALRKEMAAARTQAWHGKGPYRVVLAKTGKVYGDLGPYVTARAGLSDAKTLLRRMAPAGEYRLSNVEGQKSAGKKFAQGVIVDGYVAQGSPDIGAGAFVIRVGDTAATRKDVFPKGLRSNRRNRRNRRNTSKVDPVAVRELVLFTENDGTLYRQATSIITNLAKKMAKGQFDKTKAIKAMGYLADSGGRKYAKEYGAPVRGSWQSYPMAKVSRIFSPATRRAAAADLLDDYMEQIEEEAASMGGSRKRNPRVSFKTKGGPVSFQTKKKARRNSVDFPSQAVGGKAAHDDDFRAGWRAGEAAIKRSRRPLDISDAKKRYKRVSNKYGSWWVDGFGGAIDWDRGAHRSTAVQIAGRFGLIHLLDFRNNGTKSIKGLKISGHRWRDSYGNTYHRAYITVNGRHVGTTPISYGYGHHYLQTAKEWLKGHGYRKPSGRMSTYDAGYDDVKRKKDL